MFTEIRKYWVAEDGQSSLGSWSVSTPDDEIWMELEEQGFDKTGSIEVGEWTDNVYEWDSEE